MMRIYAISDLHGYLPEAPECELLLLGGDYCPTRDLEQERRFMSGPFSTWLKAQKARYIVGVAGNHDFILQHDPEFARSLPWRYLQDELLDLEGVRIYGTPWTPMFYNWAFMLSERELAKKFETIPSKLDILLTHGPAYRRLDKTANNVHAGSTALFERIAVAQPDSVVCGHIHEARGVLDTEHTRYYNVSHVDLRYEPKHGFTFIPLKV